MAAPPGPRYSIRKRFLTIAGASLEVFDEAGAPVAFCRQKAFKLKEDLRLYTDESKAKEVLRIHARTMFDIGTIYDVFLPDGAPIGSLKRKAWKSMVRDEWLVLDATGSQVGLVREDSGFMAFVRRFIEFASWFYPQEYHVLLGGDGGELIASLRQNINPFVHKLTITVVRDDEAIDDLVLLALGCLLLAVEGRQG